MKHFVYIIAAFSFLTTSAQASDVLVNFGQLGQLPEMQQNAPKSVNVYYDEIPERLAPLPALNPLEINPTFEHAAVKHMDQPEISVNYDANPVHQALPVSDIYTGDILLSPSDAVFNPASVKDFDLSAVYYNGTETDPSLGATKTLNELVRVMKVYPETGVTLRAYANDPQLNKNDARKIAFDRARSVRDFLTAQGVHKDRIFVRAVGSDQSHAAAQNPAQHYVSIELIKG